MGDDDPDHWQPLHLLALMLLAQAGERKEKQAERSRVGMRYVPPAVSTRRRETTCKPASRAARKLKFRRE